jgi:hypothetical protein
VPDETITARDRIREVLGEVIPPDFNNAFLDRVAARIDEALFGPPPGKWVGPQMPAGELASARKLLDDGVILQPVGDLLDHIASQAATIRNQNAEMDDQRRRLRELDALRAEVPLALYLTGLDEVMGRGLMAERVPAIADVLRAAAAAREVRGRG